LRSSPSSSPSCTGSFSRPMAHTCASTCESQLACSWPVACAMRMTGCTVLATPMGSRI
jgi:hypothetical protein